MTISNINIHGLSSLLAACTSFAIAFFVLFKNKKRRLNIAFTAFSLCIASWCLSHFFILTAQTKAQALELGKIFFSPVTFMPPLWIYIVYRVIGKKIESDKFTRSLFNASLFLSPLFFALSFTHLIFLDAAPRLAFSRFYVVPGKTFPFFIGYWFFYGLYGSWKLLHHSRITSGHTQNQIKYFFASTFVGVVGAFIYFCLAYGLPISFPHDFLIIIYLVLLAYAIVRYRLMDIAVIITRTALFLAVYSVVLGIPFLISAFFKGWLIQHLGGNWWTGPFSSLFVLGAIGPFVYFRLEKKAEAILLKEQRRYQETLKNTAVDLTRIRNVQKLLDHIAVTITEAVRISHAAIYALDVKSEEYLLKSSVHVKKKQPPVIKTDTALIAWLHIHKESLVYEEVKRKAEDSPHTVFGALEKQMHSLHATVVVPCCLENKLLDILILGDKLSGKIYTSDDLDNFSFLASEAALATENASLYGKIEDEVRQRTEELVGVQTQLIQAEKLATVGTLAGGVAHEINNPLTAILTNVQMLLMESEKLDTDSKESLELIEEATKRCRTIVQKLMTYSKKPLETTIRAKINVADIINKVIAFLGYQLQQDNITIRADLKNKEYSVNANPNELEQVLTNIILNAKDAIKLNKETGTIAIGLQKNAKLVTMTIEDDGVGMSKEILSRIFDPFFTTKDVGKGLGLGLSICQAIIDKHNGTINVQSEPGKGAVFTIQLPSL